MKSYFILILGVLVFTPVSTIFAQSTSKPKGIETATFEVKGVCGMCEKRIETAALIKGVKMVNWDRQTHMMTVMYKPKKVALSAVHEAIADAGHDTSEATAPVAIYEKLPGCCLYREGIEDH